MMCSKEFLSAAFFGKIQGKGMEISSPTRVFDNKERKD